MSTNYKEKYLDLRAKHKKDTDVAYKLGYADGLKEGSKEKIRNFCTRMVDHSDKTLAIFNDRESVDKAVKIITEGNGSLISLTPVRQTLEDIFLKEVIHEKQTT